MSRTGAGNVGDTSVEGEVVRLSAGGVRGGIDVTNYEGQVGAKEVTIEAPVKRPDGGVVRKTMIVMVQRAVLKAEPEIAGRWIVTSIR